MLATDITAQSLLLLLTTELTIMTRKLVHGKMELTTMELISSTTEPTGPLEATTIKMNTKECTMVLTPLTQLTGLNALINKKKKRKKKTRKKKKIRTRTVKIRTARTKIAKIRTAKTRIAKTRTAKTRTAKTRTAKTRTAKIRMMKRKTQPQLLNPAKMMKRM